MDLKKKVIYYLDGARIRLSNEENDLPPSRKSNQPRRMYDNQEVCKKIQNINFINSISGFEKIMSPHKTFFNGHTMYYDEYTLSQYNDREQVFMIMNEFFNVHQGYYDNNQLHKGHARKVKNISFLCIFHVGLIPEKWRVWYALSKRGKLIKEFSKKYSESHDIRLGMFFEPNKENAKYLYYDFIANKNKSLGDIIDVIDNGKVVHCKIAPLDLGISATGMYIGRSREAKEINYKKNSMIRKKNMPDDIKMVKKLAGI